MSLHAAPAGHRHHTDVVIVGAGPVGLFAVFECGMLKLHTHVVDALEEVGGQCTALYPEKPIYDIPAYPQVQAAHLVEQLEKQAAPFGPTFHLGQQVVAIDGAAGDFVVRTAAGTEIACKAVIIAAGGGAFGPNKPPLEGIEAYEGTSVFYLVKRREDFRDRRVVIAGGGDSAVDWANSLAEVAASVAVVHRRPKFRAAPESVAQMERLVSQGRIELVVPYQLAGLDGADGKLIGVRVKTLDGDERTVPADVLLPFFGLAMDPGPLADMNMDLEKNHLVVDPTTYQTSRPGIYAVGDIGSHPHKLKLILCGFSEAAVAAHQAFGHARPNEVLKFEYSTTKGVQAAE